MSKAAKEAEGRLEFLGAIEPRVTKQANGKFTLHDIPIFTLHERDGNKFDADWMNKTIAKQKANRLAGFLPRLIIGHNDEEGQGKVEKPAVGALDDFYFNEKEGWLYANYVDVPEDMVNQIKDGAWPGRSIEVYPEENEITALALLGGTPPFFKMPDIRFDDRQKMKGPKLHYSLETGPMPKDKNKTDYLHEGDPEEVDERIKALVVETVNKVMAEMRTQAAAHDDNRLDAAGHDDEETEEEKKKREEAEAMAASNPKLAEHYKTMRAEYKAMKGTATRLQTEVAELKADNERERWLHRYAALRLPEKQLDIAEEADFIMELPEKSREDYFTKVTRFIPSPQTKRVDTSKYAAGVVKGSQGEMDAINAFYEKNKDKYRGKKHLAMRDFRAQQVAGTAA